MLAKFWSNQISNSSYPISLICTIILGHPGGRYPGLDIKDGRPDNFHLATFELHLVWLLKSRSEIENISPLKLD